MFYVGSHLINTRKNYICSSKRMMKAYKKRPTTFKRRMLETHDSIDRKSLLAREQLWLNLIKK